jgi:N-hydroxyarylamine O-acetyltransferase
VGIDVFAERHALNVTSPASGFRRIVTCQRRHATGADVLRGRVLTRQDGATTTTSTVESSAGLLAVLDDVFGMRLAVPAAALAALGTRMCAAHDEWLARRAVAS